MDPSVIHSISPNRRIAYILTDYNLNVVGGNDPAGILGQIGPERSLVKLIPELTAREPGLRNVLSGKRPSLELLLTDDDSLGERTAYLTIVSLPYQDQSGQIVGLLLLLEDVTEVVALKQRLGQQSEELTAAKAELQHLDQIKSMFVSLAAHELRTPLTPIKGYLEMLLEEDLGPLSEEQRQYLELVQTSASQLLDTLNGLLDLTRIETGQVELVLEPVDLTALVENVVAEFVSHLQTKAQQLTLQASTELPPMCVDEVRVKHVLRNLLDNAHRHTPHGGRIVIALTPAEEAGFVQISVTDTGPGISTEDQKRLFTRFFRAEQGQQSQSGGIGLGLYTARLLVALHGGHLWVESELGQGSTFHVTLPVIEELNRT